MNLIAWFERTKSNKYEEEDAVNYKTEAASLLAYHSYEDIGRAFVEEAALLDPTLREDSIKSFFVHRVSFNCFLQMQKKATSSLQIAPEPSKTFGQKVIGRLSHFLSTGTRKT